MSGPLDLRFLMQTSNAKWPSKEKARTVNKDISTIVTVEAGLEEQRLETVHTKILLNSDPGQSLRDLWSTVVRCTLRI